MSRKSTNSIGPYIIESLLGQGGMGVVYKCRHAESGTSVAVKTISCPAEEHCERALRVARELKDRRHEAIWLGTQAVISSERGSRDEALNLLHQALSILDQVPDPTHQAEMYCSLATIHRLQGDERETSIIYLHKASSLLEQTSKNPLMIKLWCELGHHSLQPDPARHYLLKARHLAQSLQLGPRSPYLRLIADLNQTLEKKF